MRAVAVAKCQSCPERAENDQLTSWRREDELELQDVPASVDSESQLGP